MQELRNKQQALENAVVAAHQRVVRSEADAAAAQQEAQAARAETQIIQQELQQNAEQWKAEAEARLAAESKAAKASEQLASGHAREQCAIRAADKAVRAREALLALAAEQQRRAGNLTALIPHALTATVRQADVCTQTFDQSSTCVKINADEQTSSNLHDVLRRQASCQASMRQCKARAKAQMGELDRLRAKDLLAAAPAHLRV